MIIPLFLDTDDRRFFDPGSRRAVADICNAVHEEIVSLLPNLPPKLFVACQTGVRIIPETGEAGTAMSSNRIQWTVDASSARGIASIAEQHLRPTLYHELHHVARGWLRHGGIGRLSIMDAVVSEGLASAFERDETGRNPPWAIYPPAVVEWVEELSGLPSGASYRDWMFQHPDGRRWIGYRSGVYIVDCVHAHTGLSAAQLVTTSTADVMAMAGLQQAPS